MSRLPSFLRRFGLLFLGRLARLILCKAYPPETEGEALPDEAPPGKVPATPSLCLIRIATSAIFCPFRKGRREIVGGDVRTLIGWKMSLEAINSCHLLDEELDRRRRFVSRLLGAKIARPR